MDKSQHTLALHYLNTIKERLGFDVLKDNEIDFIHNILENERLTAETGKLTQKEFNHLARIAQSAIERKTKKERK